jgi:hypothetical protein
MRFLPLPDVSRFRLAGFMVKLRNHSFKNGVTAEMSQSLHQIRHVQAPARLILFILFILSKHPFLGCGGRAGVTCRSSRFRPLQTNGGTPNTLTRPPHRLRHSGIPRRPAVRPKRSAAYTALSRLVQSPLSSVRRRREHGPGAGARIPHAPLGSETARGP